MARQMGININLGDANNGNNNNRGNDNGGRDNINGNNGDESMEMRLITLNMLHAQLEQPA